MVGAPLGLDKRWKGRHASFTQAGVGSSASSYRTAVTRRGRGLCGRLCFQGSGDRKSAAPEECYLDAERQGGAGSVNVKIDLC